MKHKKHADKQEEGKEEQLESMHVYKCIICTHAGHLCVPHSVKGNKLKPGGAESTVTTSVILFHTLAQ